MLYGRYEHNIDAKGRIFVPAKLREKLGDAFIAAAVMDHCVCLYSLEEWDKLQADSETPSTLVTGVVVARTEFVQEHPEAVSSFLDHYASSVEFVNTNVEDAAQLVGSYDIVTAEVAQKAIPACNIVFVEGAEMKDKLSGYLTVLFDQNAKSVGGTLPADDFYYSR